MLVGARAVMTPGTRDVSAVRVNESSPVRYVSVVCPVCRARLDERVAEKPRQIKCPDCFTAVRVPARTEVDAQEKRKPAAPVREPGTYALRADGEPRSQTESRQKALDEGVVLVVCGVCGARLHPRPRRDAHVVECPDCRESVRVPSKQEVAEKRKAEEFRKRKLDAIEPLPVPKPEAPAELRTSYWEAREAVRREPDPEPARWTFFSGVFTFPWHAEVVTRWVYLSVGFTALGLLTAVLLMLMGGASGYSGIVLAFFALPAIWIGIWTLSYAAACWLVVVEDTAAGNQRIENWLPQNWREWVLQAAYLVYVVSLALVAGHGAGKLVELAGGEYAWGFGPTAWLLFPVIVLSSLESISAWVPISGPIVRSLMTHAGGWIMFYLLSSLVVLGWATVWRIAVAFWPWPALAGGGVVSSAVWLIHARLLGRLGWYVSRGEGDSARED
jgi:hypothetical protein